MLCSLAISAAMLSGGAGTLTGAEPQFPPEHVEFFENRVRPLLADHCSKCHNATERKGNLVLDSRDNLLKGGDSGPAVIPGEPDASELILAVRYGADGYQMPPDGKLDAAAIATLEEWVALGAPWPNRDAAPAAAAGEFDLAARAARWSFQPLRTVDIPPVSDSSWPATPVDRFLLARLEASGLRPAAAADGATWLRRAYLDVVGLPPAPEDVAAYVTDDRPDARARVVERLLASPHFGERWGRHWLDLVCYAESRGHEFDYDVPNPWHYRDYVIRAHNDDVSYDRIVLEHVAGDLLSDPADAADAVPFRTDPLTGANESVLATGFWFLGEWVHSPVDIRQEEADRFANMIDVFSKTFLGLTVACARCHDHKFDPITQRDFYALQGYLQSSVYRQALFETMDRHRRIARELEALREEATAALRPVLLEFAAACSNASAPPVRDAAPPSYALPEPCAMIVDYSEPLAGPLAEGGLFGTRPVRAGEVRLGDDVHHPVAGVATAAYVERNPDWRDFAPSTEAMDEPGRLGGWQRAGRSLRTPTFEITHGKIYALVCGGCNTLVVVDSHVMLNGPLHGSLLAQHPAEPGWRWIAHDVGRYSGHRAHVEFVVRGEEPFRIQKVIQADAPPAALAADAAGATREVGDRTGHELLDALLADPAAFALDPDVVHARLRDAVAPFAERRRQLLARLGQASQAAPAMADGSAEDEYVFIRGNWKKRGDTVARRFLEVFGGSDGAPSLAGASGSGRLKLARQMIDPRQTPILPRVIVNRIWQHYFGRGLVATPDDFGHMGQDPSHPELLDWLAGELVSHGWSLKHIHRLILLSAAYGMESVSEAKGAAHADEIDPLNVLLHRMPVRRLEGEIIRDQILALSGRLDERLYGRSVPVYLTPFMEGRGRPGVSGPLDGDGRRSLYLAVRRNFPDPFLQAFDFPTPHTTIGRRSVSNVPAQALALMNSPFVAEQARSWAEQLLADTAGCSTRERVMHLYHAAFSRHPTAAEQDQAEAFIARQSREYNVSVDDPAVWADYCHVLLNAKEFVFVR